MEMDQELEEEGNNSNLDKVTVKEKSLDSNKEMAKVKAKEEVKEEEDN
jgi:hypothetical protein